MKPITALTYNISFEAMTNRSIGTATDLGKHCKTIGDTKLTICGKNMANMIDGIPASLSVGELDLVGIQEASRWHLLQDAAKNTLRLMGHVHSGSTIHRPGKKPATTEMVSFYNKNRFTLKHQYTGEFAKGRPYQILVLAETSSPKEGVIFINVHNPHPEHIKGHKKRPFTFDLMKDQLTVALDSLSLSDTEKQYRIIALGDFNETGWMGKKLSPKEWAPFASIKDATGKERTISLKKEVWSCCHNDGKWSDKKGNIVFGHRSGDYIFDSAAPADNTYPPAYNPKLLQSDHLPIVAVL
jgi:hypothetical protein